MALPGCPARTSRADAVSTNPSDPHTKLSATPPRSLRRPWTVARSIRPTAPDQPGATSRVRVIRSTSRGSFARDLVELLPVDHFLTRAARVQERCRHGAARQASMPQHAHQRHDSAPAADEQQRSPPFDGRPDEGASDRPAQSNRVVGLQLAGEERGHLAAVEPLDRELQAGRPRVVRQSRSCVPRGSRRRPSGVCRRAGPAGGRATCWGPGGWSSPDPSLHGWRRLSPAARRSSAAL